MLEQPERKVESAMGKNPKRIPGSKGMVARAYDFPFEKKIFLDSPVILRPETLESVGIDMAKVEA